MKVRVPFVVVFVILVILAGFLGLARSLHFTHDKLLHFTVFFILALDFYWVFDATRKQCINLTGVVIGGAGGIGSEFVQTLLAAPERQFDPLDILFNLIGCLCAILLCSWYHNRLLKRRRNARYRILRGTDDQRPQPQPAEEIDLENQATSSTPQTQPTT